MSEPLDSTISVSQDPTEVRANIIEAATVMVQAFRLAVEDNADTLLSGVLDGLATLVQHDAAGVYVLNRSGERFSHKQMRGCDLAVADLEAAVRGEGVVGQALTTGVPVLATSLDHVSGRACARSRLVAPIVGSQSRVLGALDVWSDQEHGYSQDAQALIAVYASAVAGAIEGSRLLAEVEVKRRLDDDLALARTVMEELLPHATPSIEGFDIAGAHESSLAVGGDYYEFIPLVDNRWGIVVADVVGKGIAAAILVSALRASIASLVGHELSLRAIMRRANRYFFESVEESRYVTLFYAILDPPRRRMLYVNAGHVPPLLRRHSGDVELLDEGGVPLGLFETPGYFEGHVTMREGDILTLYTDGVVETADAEDTFYGVERLAGRVEALSSGSATEICSGIMQDIRRHGGGTRGDDRTLVVMKSRTL